MRPGNYHFTRGAWRGVLKSRGYILTPIYNTLNANAAYHTNLFKGVRSNKKLILPK
ncbi:hypothetical protein Hanom_Chr16g01478671 [Helianthus anomalus]